MNVFLIYFFNCSSSLIRDLRNLFDFGVQIRHWLLGGQRAVSTVLVNHSSHTKEKKGLPRIMMLLLVMFSNHTKLPEYIHSSKNNKVATVLCCCPPHLPPNHLSHREFMI